MWQWCGHENSCSHKPRPQPNNLAKGKCSSPMQYRVTWNTRTLWLSLSQLHKLGHYSPPPDSGQCLDSSVRAQQPSACWAVHAEPELESSRTRSPARSYDSYEDNPGSGKADPIAVIQPKTKAYFSYLSTSPTYIRHFFGVPVTSKSWTRTAPSPSQSSHLIFHH